MNSREQPKKVFNVQAKTVDMRTLAGWSMRRMGIIDKQLSEAFMQLAQFSILLKDENNESQRFGIRMHPRTHFSLSSRD